VSFTDVRICGPSKAAAAHPVIARPKTLVVLLTLQSEDVVLFVRRCTCRYGPAVQPIAVSDKIRLTDPNVSAR